MQYFPVPTLYVILVVWMFLAFGGSLKVHIPLSMYRSFPTRLFISWKQDNRKSMLRLGIKSQPKHLVTFEFPSVPKTF